LVVTTKSAEPTKIVLEAFLEEKQREMKKNQMFPNQYGKLDAAK